MRPVIRVEALKLVRSPVGTIGSLALVLGTVLLLVGITAALASGEPQLTAKVGPGATLDWPGLLASAAQITSAGGLLGTGVVLAWMVGREFTDGTLAAVFALPVGRGRIAVAKLTVYAVWAAAVSLVLTLALLVLGLTLGYGVPAADAWAGLARQLGLGLLTAAIATPVAWVTTVARSLLAGVGCAIGLVVVAQVGALAGAGGWMPFAAPALWAMSGDTAVTAVQLGLTLVVAAVFAAATCVSWARMQVVR